MLNMVKRLTVYAKNLPELREKEKQIAKDLEDNILTDRAIKKLTLNKGSITNFVGFLISDVTLPAHIKQL